MKESTSDNEACLQQYVAMQRMYNSACLLACQLSAYTVSSLPACPASQLYGTYYQQSELMRGCAKP